MMGKYFLVVQEDESDDVFAWAITFPCRAGTPMLYGVAEPHRPVLHDRVVLLYYPVPVQKGLPGTSQEIPGL